MKPDDESLGSSPTLVGGQGGGVVETLAEGAVLGNYRIVRFLGAGGMGAVYIAEHIHQKTRHALKTIRPEFAKQQNFAERFQREAKLATRLKHPHIVACTETGVAEGIPYLVMDYIEGPHGEPLNLRQLLDQRRERGELLDEDEAAAVGLEICKALDYAHSYRDAEVPNGIIHRDLKPANILLDKDTKLYIADFGLARLLGEKFEESVQAHSLSKSLGEQATLGKRVSVSADAVGTFDYMSPEQREGRVADARSDVFAMGVILYELLTGRKVVGVPAPPSVVRPGLSSLWDEIILERALAYEPGERYATAGDFCRAIENVPLNPLETPPLPEEKPAAPIPVPEASVQPEVPPACADNIQDDTEEPQPPPAGKKPLGLTSLALFLLGVCVAGMWLYHALPETNKQKSPSSSVMPVNAATGMAQRSLTPALSTGLAKSVTIRLDDETSLKMNLIPNGSFSMGSPESDPLKRPDDVPQHEVIITKPFYMGVTEVTRQQFQAFVKQTGYQTEAEKRGWGTYYEHATVHQLPGRDWNHPGYPAGADYPVACITWEDANRFCEWLSTKTGWQIRLPTEAEWEYACRANTTTCYQWGDASMYGEGWCNVSDQSLKESEQLHVPGINTRGVCLWRDGYAFASPGGSYRPNVWGLFDMHGNLWEWCADWYQADYYKSSERTDPRGYGFGTERVIRGGCFDEAPRDFRSASRMGVKPDCADFGIGFRVCCTGDTSGSSEVSPSPSTMTQTTNSAQTYASDAGAATSATENLRRGLVLYFSFDNIQGDQVLDDSGLGNHGTRKSATVTTGVAGNALAFDDDDAIVTVSNHPSLNLEKALTLSAWVRGGPSQPKGYPRIIDKFIWTTEHGYALKILTETGRGRLALFPTGDQSYQADSLNDAILDDQWHHLTGTFDGSELRCYVDGVLSGTTSCEGRIVDADKELTIGNGFDGNVWFPFKGSIDEVAVFNRALSEDEVRQLYDLGKRGQCLAKVNLQTPPPVQVPQSVANQVIPATINQQTIDLGGGVALDMVWIPAGEFMMGSTDDEEARLKQRLAPHRVTISTGFWMGKYEVTQEQYQQVMGENPSKVKGVGLKAPVVSVDWSQTKAFCDRLQARLPANLSGRQVRMPTEAEWEYACRAGMTTSFHTGDSDSALARAGWYRENSDGKPHDVGQKEGNAWGLFDMHGNVWEMCGRVRLKPNTSTARDPQAVENTFAIRGGAWECPPSYCRSAARFFYGLDKKSIHHGFRIVVQ